MSYINWTIPARKYDIPQNVFRTSLIGQEYSEDESEDSERHDLKFLRKYIEEPTSDYSLSHLIIYNRYSEGDYQIMLPYQNISFARIDTDCVFWKLDNFTLKCSYSTYSEGIYIQCTKCMHYDWAEINKHILTISVKRKRDPELIPSLETENCVVCQLHFKLGNDELIKQEK